MFQKCWKRPGSLFCYASDKDFEGFFSLWNEHSSWGNAALRAVVLLLFLQLNCVCWLFPYSDCASRKRQVVYKVSLVYKVSSPGQSGINKQTKRWGCWTILSKSLKICSYDSKKHGIGLLVFLNYIPLKLQRKTNEGLLKPDQIVSPLEEIQKCKLSALDCLKLALLRGLLDTCLRAMESS